MDDDVVCRRGGGQLFTGLLVIFIGVYLLLRSFGVPIPRVGWPVVLMAIGVFLWVKHGFGNFLGSVLVVLGVLVLLRRLDVFDFDLGRLWPLLLVAFGIRILWTGTHPRAPRRLEISGPAGAVLNESAAFGGGERKVASQDFKGGHVSVAFGGFDIDLRESVIKDPEAVIDVESAFGGVDFKVPTAWNVTLRVSSVFGGCEDKTLHPSDPAAPRLLITGSTVFGGIEVGN